MGEEIWYQHIGVSFDGRGTMWYPHIYMDLIKIGGFDQW